MDSIQVTNPFLRSGPPCRRFESAIQLSLNRSPFKLPALALILAEVLVLHAYSPSRSHDYLIDLPSSDIRRSRRNRRKFAISNRGRTFNIFCNATEEADSWEAILSHAFSRRFEQHYRIERKIADGRHSQIYLAYPYHGPSTAFIVKVNNRTAECNSFTNRSQFERDAHLKLVQSFDVTPGARGGMERKVDLDEREHREYTHKLFLEKIVPIRDSFGTATEDFLVFEHQDGEVLSTVLAKHGPLSEREARVVMWDLLTAVHYMHEQGVVHRDIRASNVFYWRDGGNTCAKLFDLSEARQIPDGISAEEPFRDSPGQSRYKAIEILSGRYHGKPADVWSCGVLLYHMLSGTFPFQGENEQALAGNMVEPLHAQSLFSAPVWASVSAKAISLIRQMLQIDHFKRPSALGARSHQWLSNDLALRRDDTKSAQASPAVNSQGEPRVVAASRVRKVSPLDANLLPAAFEGCGEHDSFSSSACGLPQAAAVASASLKTDATQESVTLTVDTTVGDGKEYDIGCTSSRYLNPKSTARPENPMLLESFSASFPVERCEDVAHSDVTRPTSVCSLARQESIPALPSMSIDSPLSSSASSNHLFSSSSNTCFLNGGLASKRNAYTREVVYETAREPSKKTTHSSLGLIPLTKRFPDRQRSGSEQATVTCHRFHHEFTLSSAAKQCKRTKMEPTRVLRGGSHPPNQVDHIRKIQEEEKMALLDTMSPTKLLDDGMNSLTRNDPMFHFKANPKAIHVASPRKSPIKPGVDIGTTNPEYPNSGTTGVHQYIPLRDEMCRKTFIMHSVKTAAKVGLSEFSRRHPLPAKLLFRSPSAQLQLSVVLPYRRKFRTAGIAMKAMFRIISLKKGTCLTRRVVRGQTLPTELWSLLTDIRRKCHMRPLRARMPKLLPPDIFGAKMCKPRFERPPRINATPHRFWARQREVRLGIVSKAWEVAKEKLVQLSVAVGVVRRGDGEAGHDGESDQTASIGLVSYFCRRIHGFFRRDLEEEEEEEKYHHTEEIV